MATNILIIQHKSVLLTRQQKLYQPDEFCINKSFGTKPNPVENSDFQKKRN